MGKKELYGSAMSIIEAFAGIDNAKKIDTKLRFNKEINLKTPTTLSEKVTYIELHEQSPLASICTDKYEVRNFVKNKGLEDILVPVVAGPWYKIEDIDFSSLPNRFVFKATHGCKMNYLVPDRSKLNIKLCTKEMKKWLETTYGEYSIEPHYLSIPHRIYAEQYLNDADKLIDYKIHCFNGKPIFILVCSNRDSNSGAHMKVSLDLYDLNWKNIPEIIGSGMEKAGNGNVKKPENLNEMVDIAKKLSKGFKFVRVDLYDINGKIYFSELTFTPGCGIFPCFSKKFDIEMGKLLVV